MTREGRATSREGQRGGPARTVGGTERQTLVPRLVVTCLADADALFSRWSEVGARRLFALRVVLLNGEWAHVDRLRLIRVAA